MVQTTRDQKILLTLTTKVRVLSLPQVAGAFFAGDFSSAQRRLKALVERKVLVQQKLLARILPPIEQPLYGWEPGRTTPRFERFSRLLKDRWNRIATRRTTIYIAAERLSGVVGSRSQGRLKHPLQISHDLGLASVYLFLLRQYPCLASRWAGEDFLCTNATRKRSVPDAMILSNGISSEMAIEFGGVYSAKRLAKFHRYCFARELNYEVW